MSKRELVKKSLMTEVAILYYRERLTQEEIGKRLFLSRTRISRLLQQAQDCGIVEIHIHSELERNYALENIVQQRFGLKEVLIYNGYGRNEKEIGEGVTALAASYIKSHIHKDMTIGVSWGKSVSETVNALKVDKPMPVNIAQIMGFGATEDVARNCNDIAGRLAAKYGGRVYYMNTPLFVADQYVKQRMLCDPVVSKTLEMAKSADIVITSVGTMDYVSTSNPWLGYMNETMLQEIKQQAGVGCIGALFFNSEGEKLDNTWNRQCISVALEDLRRMDEVVCVAWGEAKCKPILSAMKGRLIDILVSDSSTIGKAISIIQA